MERRYRTFEGRVIRCTEKAVLVVDPHDEEFWIPRSCCLDGDCLDEGDGDLQVASWWLERGEHEIRWWLDREGFE